MLGEKVPHPQSTNFEVEFENPRVKRVKRDESTDSSLCQHDTDGLEDQPSPSKPIQQEIADSEAESDEEVVQPAKSLRKTELESALPSIETDKEAIAAYEASRAAQEVDELDLPGRMGQRKWVQGKSSIYVDAFNLALGTVLEDEGHLFDETELAVFHHWRDLSYEAQYL